MKTLLLALALLVMPSPAEAAPKPMDFAYGMPLSLPEKGAIYRLALPREVYEAVTRDDLADVRVFNSAEAVVPHTLRRPRGETDAETSNVLPFFPLYGGERLPGKDGLSMRVEKSGERTTVQVYSDNAEDSGEPRLSGYLIDATEHKERIHEFEIDWQEEDESRVIPVSVEWSKDMNHWASAVPRATLVQMKYHGHEIVHKRIRMPHMTAPYYRITWTDHRDGVVVTEIRAIHRKGGLDPGRQWISLTGRLGTADKEDRVVTYEYEVPARIPVDAIRLGFPEKNTLVRATVFSRSSPELPWQDRQDGVFFHLEFEEVTLVQSTAALHRTSDRYWKVAVEPDAFSDPEITPIVELGWLPHELLFVARGEGPFMLAYGSARLGQEAQPGVENDSLARVVAGEKDRLIKTAEALPRTVLGGPDRLEPPPPPRPWKTWLLWAVLLVGVGVIAKMALSLSKGMKQEERE